MKIERLYTLNQFVDLTESMSYDIQDTLSLIWDYNDFLKQPLKKEMFVNELKKPTIGYVAWLEEWQQAEKKIIFKDNQFEGLSNEEFVNPKTKKPFRNVAMEDFKTIGELAEYYEGELELQNVEL